MNRQELMARAMHNIARRRQQAETEAMRRREEALEALPQLQALEQLSVEAGAAAVSFAAGGHAAEAAQQLDALRDIGVRRRQLLASAGLGEEALAPRYTCADCADTGRQGERLCHCVTQEAARLRREELAAHTPLARSRFENFRLDVYPEHDEAEHYNPRESMQRVLQNCLAYVESFGPHAGSLFMFGDSGLGKTHLALAMAQKVLDKGYDVVYQSAQSAFAAVSRDRFDAGSTVFQNMMDADLLVLDDLGTEYLDAYVLSRLYELVNGREKRPTIYTSNICEQSLLCQRYTEKLASRLLGNCELLRFYGRDVRLYK